MDPEHVYIHACSIVRRNRGISNEYILLSNEKNLNIESQRVALHLKVLILKFKKNEMKAINLN